jgi:hypothetical protein
MPSEPDYFSVLTDCSRINRTKPGKPKSGGSTQNNTAKVARYMARPGPGVKGEGTAALESLVCLSVLLKFCLLGLFLGAKAIWARPGGHPPVFPTASVNRWSAHQREPALLTQSLAVTFECGTLTACFKLVLCPWLVTGCAHGVRSAYHAATGQRGCLCPAACAGAVRQRGGSSGCPRACTSTCTSTGSRSIPLQPHIQTQGKRRQ